MSARWILLVLEDGLFPDESICYAIKFARRMACAISVLMLAGNTSDGDEYHSDMQDTMKHTVDNIIAEGIPAEGNFAYGDKASAFLKHLALNPSLTAIVWGGNEEIGKVTVKKKGDYWFTKVKSSIQCPVVRPEVKDKFRKQIKARSFKG
ncbi:MAG: hypothetical protein KJ737_11755 [Proteobacteria bacterium]|nr:hypothetical protein [Pseudomonadota bacterium]